MSTAEDIVAAGRRLLDEGGAKAVSMRKVAEVVGITAMAIYRHYPDREALLNAVADQGFSDLAASLRKVTLRGDFEKRLLTVAEIYLDHALVHPRLFELMFLTQRAGARRYPQDFKAGRSPTANLFAEVIQDGMRNGEVREDDFWEITFELGALSHGLIMLYLAGRVDADQAAFRALYRRSFRRYVHGILA